MHVPAPLTFDSRGRTAHRDDDAHLRDLVEAVLMTAPGERVGRPEFGCGLLHLVFSPGGDQVAAATQALVLAALHRWLGDLAEFESVEVRAEEGVLHVTVRYARRSTGERTEAQFTRRIGGDAPAGGSSAGSGGGAS